MILNFGIRRYSRSVKKIFRSTLLSQLYGYSIQTLPMSTVIPDKPASNDTNNNAALGSTGPTAAAIDSSTLNIVDPVLTRSVPTDLIRDEYASSLASHFPITK